MVAEWTHHANGGCEGLAVGVRAAPGAGVHPLPTMEYAYEEPGVVVLERRATWFRIRLSSGSAWLESSEAEDFYDLERLFVDRLTYLTRAWGCCVREDRGDHHLVPLQGLLNPCGGAQARRTCPRPR